MLSIVSLETIGTELTNDRGGGDGKSDAGQNARLRDIVMERLKKVSLAVDLV